MSYDIRILVNGNNCRQHHHNGRIFVEAKDGSEYSLEVKNNTWGRILVCCSVDGLNILTGQAATENGPGYVISGYMANRFDGFRVSNDQVAKFVFGKKGASYAASKQDGSERNVGVIGFHVYEELVKPQPVYTPPWIINPWSTNPPVYPPVHYGTSVGDPMPRNPTIWCETTTTVKSSLPDDDLLYDKLGNSSNYCCNNIPTKGINRSFDNKQTSKISALSMGICPMPKESFDMGTGFGGAKESRVIEVEFEKGLLVLSTDIYYASRQNLIEMGVPIGNEKQVNYPSSFADSKYAKPPKNWTG
jgi:hypothetical protein